MLKEILAFFFIPTCTCCQKGAVLKRLKIHIYTYYYNNSYSKMFVKEKVEFLKNSIIVQLLKKLDLFFFFLEGRQSYTI